MKPTIITVIDQAGIARRFGVARETVKWWRANGRKGRAFPDPLPGMTTRPVWLLAHVEDWVELTG